MKRVKKGERGQLSLDFLQKSGKGQPTPLNGKFDIGSDLAIERAGGLFCHACLTGRTDHSPDPHYCQMCYEFRLQEAELLPPGKRPKWVPESPVGNTEPRTATQRRGQNSAPSQNTPTVEKRVLSTSNANGRPRLNLPGDKIRELAATGLGPKGIAAILCDRGIPVSGRTIKRMLLTFANVGTG